MGRFLLPLALLGVANPAWSATWGDSAALPAYRAVETVSDGIYGLLRGHLFAPLLPTRLARKMSAVPVSSSENLFSSELRSKQDRAWSRIVESRPAGPASAAELSTWGRRALDEESAALGDSVVGALAGRYQIPMFGRETNLYAARIDNWDADFLASAAAFGGAYAYLSGLRANYGAGPLRFDLDVRPGDSLRRAFERGDGRLASLGISPRGLPLSLRSELELRSGRADCARTSLSYSRRF